MAKKCVVSMVIRLLRGFFGFGGLFLHPLRVFVIDGRPEPEEGVGVVRAWAELAHGVTELAHFQPCPPPGRPGGVKKH
jgi:hypothetical protein